MQELVDHGRTGILFRPGDPEDLAEKVQWAWSHVRETLSMGKECRAEYEARYTAQKNYQTLINVYRRTITRSEERRVGKECRSRGRTDNKRKRNRNTTSSRMRKRKI